MQRQFTKRDQLFLPVSFAAKARAKDESRPILTGILVTDILGKRSIVGLDGFRLHWVEYPPKYLDDAGLVSGFYNVIKATKTKVIIELENPIEGVKLPDIDYVLSQADLSSYATVFEVQPGYEIQHDIEASVFSAKYAIAAETVLNTFLIADMFALFDKVSSSLRFRISRSPKNRFAPAHITIKNTPDGSYQAIIMPVARQDVDGSIKSA